MNWIPFTRLDQLDEILKSSYDKPQWIFKHSTRCGISASALHEVEQVGASLTELADCYYLDLLEYRSISNAVTERLQIPHQSPQAILVHGGKVIHHASHSAIRSARMLALSKG